MLTHKQLWDLLLWFLILWCLISYLFFTALLPGLFNYRPADLVVFFISFCLGVWVPRVHLVWMMLWMLILPQFDQHLFAWNPHLNIGALWPRSGVISLIIGSIPAFAINFRRQAPYKTDFNYTNYEKAVLLFSAWLCLGIFVALYANLKGFGGWTMDSKVLFENLLIFSSTKPYHVLQPWFFSSFSIVVPLILILFPRGQVHFTQKVFLYASVIFLIYVLLQNMTGLGYRRWGYEVNGFTEDMHASASFLVASILYVAHLSHWGSWKRNMLNASILLILIWLLFESGSKNSYLALLVFVIPYLAWLFFEHFSWKTWKNKLMVMGFVLASLYFVNLNIPWIKTLLLRLNSVNTVADIDTSILSYRGSLIASALTVFMRHPLTGYGTNNFVMAQTHKEYRTGPFFKIMQYENAHCYFAQVLADNGIIGFALWIFLFLFPIVKKLRTISSPLTFFLIGLLLTNVLAHSLLIFSFWMLYVLVLRIDLSETLRKDACRTVIA